MADLWSDPWPTSHVPVQDAQCVICRFAILEDEMVGTVLGSWLSPEFSAYTFAFPFPTDSRHALQVKVYEKCRASAWQLCCHPDPSCSRCPTEGDAFVYHIDCYHMVSKHGKPLTLRDIWTIGTWTQPLPKARYPTQPGRCGAFMDDPLADVDCIAASVRRNLPRELWDNIAEYCQESTLCRLISALHRRQLYNSLLNGKIALESPPYTNFVAWDRTKGLIAGSRPSGSILKVALDYLGIRSMAFTDHQPDEVPFKTERHDWYIVEDIANLGDTRFEFKGRFMRIRSPRKFQLWDASDPPLTHINWFQGRNPPQQIHSINLAGLTGLTVFCYRGRVCWIHPHRNASPKAAPPPLHLEREDRTYSPIYFPLAKGEKINGVWARSEEWSLELSPYGLGLGLTTNYGRSQLFGKHENTEYGGILFGALHHGSELTHLLFTGPRRAERYQDFAVTVKTSDSPSQLPESLYRPLDTPRGLMNVYLSFAPLANVKQLQLFHRLRSGASPARVCEGILIEYANGDVAALGIFHRQTDVEVFDSPTAIHFKRSIHGPVVRCSGPGAEIPVDSDGPSGAQWRTKLMEGEIKWWFNDYMNVDIE